MVPELRGLRRWGLEVFGEYGYLGGATATRWFLDPLELGPNDTLLDVGCLRGAILRLAGRRYRCTGLGFDPDAEHVSAGKTDEDAARPKVRVILGTASQTGLAASSVHAVVAFDAPFDAGEAWRILRAGGRLCLATAHEGSEESLDEALAGAGFRTEQSLDATSEALSALRGAHEKFEGDRERIEVQHALSAAIAWYEASPARRYLRWVGRRR
jgi:SAM-dependent methyltransferase